MSSSTTVTDLMVAEVTFNVVFVANSGKEAIKAITAKLTLR